MVPTLADLLGVDIPWPVDGIAVTTERRPDDESASTSSPSTAA